MNEKKRKIQTSAEEVNETYKKRHTNDTFSPIRSVCLPLKLYQTSKQININSLSLWNAGAYTRNRLYAIMCNGTTFWRRREICRKWLSAWFWIRICKRTHEDHSIQLHKPTIHISRWNARAGQPNTLIESKIGRDGEKKTRMQQQLTYSMIQAVIYLISPAHSSYNSECTSPTTGEMCWIPVCQCEMAWDQNQFSNVHFIQVHCRTHQLWAHFKQRWRAIVSPSLSISLILMCASGFFFQIELILEFEK